jgi:hypothetical protein
MKTLIDRLNIVITAVPVCTPVGPETPMLDLIKRVNTLILALQ